MKQQTNNVRHFDHEERELAKHEAILSECVTYAEFEDFKETMRIRFNDLLDILKPRISEDYLLEQLKIKESSSP